MMKTTLSPVHYHDYRIFLKELYDVQKKNQKYSYRHFAKDLGFEFSNFLHLVLQKKRNLSAEAIRKIQKHIDFSPLEKKYFELLVQANQASDEASQKKWLAEKDKLVRKKSKVISADQHSYFGKWYLPIIREVISLTPFVPHLQWISKKIKITLDEKIIREALRTLERLKMIVSVSGGWKQAEEHITTEPEVSSDLIFNYHREILHLTNLALNFPAEDRDFSSITMSLTQRQFELLKKKIQDFRIEIEHELQKDEEKPNLVAQLNMQFFKLTRD